MKNLSVLKMTTSPAFPTDLNLRIEKDGNDNIITHQLQYTFDQVEYILSEYSKLKLELQESKDEINRLESEEAHWKATLYTCRSEMVYMAEEKEKWKSTSLELERCLSNAEEMTNKFLDDRKKLRDTERKLNTCEKENQQLVAQVDVLDRMVSELQAYANAIGGLEPSPSLIAAEKMLRLSQEKLQQVEVENNSKLKILETQLELTKDTLEKFQKKSFFTIQSLDLELQSTRDSLQQLLTENNTLKEQIASLQSKVESQALEIEKIPILQNRLDLYMNEIVNLQGQIEGSCGESNIFECVRLNEQLVMMSKEVRNLTAENLKLLKTAEDAELIKKELKESYMKIDQLQGDLGKAQTDICVLRGEFASQSSKEYEVLSLCRPRERPQNVIFIPDLNLEPESELVRLMEESTGLKAQRYQNMSKESDDGTSSPLQNILRVHHKS